MSHNSQLATLFTKEAAMNSQTPVALIVQAYRKTLEQTLKLGESLSTEQLHWRAPQSGHSLAFELWHSARWADHFQAALPGMTPGLQQRLGAGYEIWTNENLAHAWGFDVAGLGFAQTGMSMADEDAYRLTFPPKEQLLAYVRRAISAATESVLAIDDEQLQAVEQPQPLTEGIWGEGTVGAALVVHLTHSSRHLGMMECLRGLQNGSGTATV
jgi:hypothetical protein